MKLSQQIIEYISKLKVTEGPLTGKPLTVLPWQKDWIRGSFAPEIETSYLSVGRGNGKTCIASALVVCTLMPDAPLFLARGLTVCVASSFQQSRILFEHVLAFLGDEVENKKKWRVIDSPQQAMIEFRETKTRFRCYSSDFKRIHGIAPSMIICDEPAQWPENSGEKMVSGLRTSGFKQERFLMISIGTRPVSRFHWFSKGLDGGGDFSRNYSCTKDESPFLQKSWRRANPSMAHMPWMKRKISKLASEARLDPSMLASLKAMYLNMGCDDTEQATLLDASIFEASEGQAEKIGPCFWGVDLATSFSQCAISGWWPSSGRLEVVAAFPGEPDLGTRGIRDGVGDLWNECARRGELIQTGGAATDIKLLLAEAFKRFGRPKAISCDRWREKELRDCLQAARIPLTSLVIRGNGWKDGAEDVRAYRRAYLENRVTTLPSLLMASAISEARVILDASANAKLCKGWEGQRRLNAKDDCASSSILAVALGMRSKSVSTVGGAYLGVAR